MALFTRPFHPALIAGIVEVKRSASARSSHANHWTAAKATEQFPGQHIVPIFPVPPLGIFLCFQALFHLQEKGFVDDGRHTTLYPYIRIMVDPDISLIVQDGVEAVLPPEAAPLCVDTPAIQAIGDVHKRDALADLSENLPDNLGLRLIDGVPAIRPLAVTKGHGAIIHLALQRIVAHPPLDILGEVRRVIFGRTLQHGFQQDAFRAVRYGFLGVDHPHPAPLQAEFIGGTVIAVSSKAVNLPA